METIGWLAFIGIGFLGLITGSFLNSWMWRTKMGVRGARSVCVGCRRALLWHENIPLLSYLWLRGRCRVCNVRIPWDYFLVELILPVLFLGLIWYHLGLGELNPWHFFRDIFFIIILSVIFVYDAKYMTILSGVVWVGAVGGLIINYFFLHQSLASLLTGAVLGGGFFWAQFLVSRGRWIGGGDVRLGAMMGFWLGFPTILTALFVAYILGAIVAVPLLLLKKKTAQSKIPFGTFLAVGTLVAMLWGNSMIEWYRGMVGW